jgi:proline dehydrogenase
MLYFLRGAAASRSLVSSASSGKVVLFKDRIAVECPKRTPVSRGLNTCTTRRGPCRISGLPDPSTRLAPVQKTFGTVRPFSGVATHHHGQDDPGRNTGTGDHPNNAATPDTTAAATTTDLNPTPNFNDHQAAFESKSTTQLLRAAVSFGLCRVPILVRHAEPMLRTSRAVLGNNVTDAVLKSTLFGHFCAGEDEIQIQKPIMDLQRAGIGSILDYAAEDDGGSPAGVVVGAPSSPAPSRADEITTEKPPIVRMYDYESEAKCDRHVETFKKCIRDVASLQKDGFAAVKVTALGNPKLLERMSAAIAEARNLFAKFDSNGDGYISRSEFEQGCRVYFRDQDDGNDCLLRLKQQVIEQFHHPDDSKLIDYISWSMMLQPEDLPAITRGCKESGPLKMATPTEEEVELISKMYQRGHELAKEAAKHGTRLLMDAEQVRFQPAIDSLVLDLQRTYNSDTACDIPIVYHTYQCYLKNVQKRIEMDVERSERFGYHFGAKLVRGAYMESERALAKAFGYPSPIHDTIDDTHHCYSGAVEYLLRTAAQADRQVELMLATHNEDSVTAAIQLMNELGIDRRSPTVSFGQLYGMKDNLTYNLGKLGYRAYKYVPYGPVSTCLPYLVRRANENSSVAGSARTEMNMIRRELLRRLTQRSFA